MTTATSFCRSPAVLVHDGWRSTMASGWTDAVVVSCSKKLEFSVFARKHGNTLEAPNIRRWQTVDVVKGIRSPRALLAALNACEATLDISLDWGRVLSDVSRLDSEWGSALTSIRLRGGPGASTWDVERSLAGEPGWNSEQRSMLDILHENCREEEHWRSKKTGRAVAFTGYPWLAAEGRLFGNPTKLLHRSRARGQGCRASYLEGISLDLLAYAGLRYSDDLHDELWGERNWQTVIDDCPSSNYFQIGEQDGAPGMSDVFFWVSVEDPREFSRELRILLVDALAQYRATKVGA